MPEATASGIPLPAVAGPEHIDPGLVERLGRPGEFPFTRGIHPEMYRARPWTIRQLAGFATAADTNRRYRMLLERGATGINGVERSASKNKPIGFVAASNPVRTAAPFPRFGKFSSNCV